jgi:hypothetical protein
VERVRQWLSMLRKQASRSDVLCTSNYKFPHDTFLFMIVLRVLSSSVLVMPADS